MIHRLVVNYILQGFSGTPGRPGTDGLPGISGPKGKCIDVLGHRLICAHNVIGLIDMSVYQLSYAQ